jgi:sporulation protein YlmC with PRC-barrel domain
MLRHLLATTALVVALGGAAQAQQTDEATEPLVEENATGATEPAIEGEATAAEEAPMTEEGTTAADELPAAEEGATTADQAPAVEPEATTAEEAPVAEEGDSMAAEPADPLAQPTAPVAGAEQPAAPQLTPVDIAQVTAEELIDANLRNPDGENLGTIDDALLDDSGNIQSLVVSFGGFLGFGKKTVEVSLDEVELMSDESGNIVAETMMTPETLEALPEYEEAPQT